MPALEVFKLAIAHHARVWGGQRLRPTPSNQTPIGEAWIIHEDSQVQSGAFAGQTLAQLAKDHGAALLGAAAMQRTGHHFPLLIKILDCADWLSVQVHPNDQQALALEGAGHHGKTEAWHLLEVAPNAQLIDGVKDGVDSNALAAAIRGGASVRDVLHYSQVQTGDTVMMHAGTMHALGPGMLLYEVQQTSDITYRVYDWDRPASAGRALHTHQSIAVTTPSRATVQHLKPQTGTATLTTCEYFTLERLQAHGDTMHGNTNTQSFHAITITENQATLETNTQSMVLQRFDTVVVPAALGAYSLQGAFVALRSSVPTQ